MQPSSPHLEPGQAPVAGPDHVHVAGLLVNTDTGQALPADDIKIIVITISTTPPPLGCSEQLKLDSIFFLQYLEIVPALLILLSLFSTLLRNVSNSLFQQYNKERSFTAALTFQLFV